MKLKKIFIPIVLMILFINIIDAQSIAPQSVNSAGAKLTQANGSLSFTVGELVVLTQTDSQGNSLGAGFTAGATLTTSVINEPVTEVLDVNVYPNPISELLNIQINHSSISRILVTIFDVQGKIIYTAEYAGISNIIGINTASFASGIYILTMRDQNKNLLGSYKIIKQ